MLGRWTLAVVFAVPIPVAAVVLFPLNVQSQADRLLCNAPFAALGGELILVLSAPAAWIVRRASRRDLPTAPGLLRIAAMVGFVVILLGLPFRVGIAQRVRIAAAQSDARNLASAISTYSAHMNALPPALDVLTRQATNAAGQVHAPFIRSIPDPPHSCSGAAEWSPFQYQPSGDGTFTIVAEGDNVVVRAP